MFKEEEEEIVMGAPQVGMPGRPLRTVIIHPDTVVPDHIIWSLFNTLFFNPCCLGFVALAYSVKSRDRRMAGDVIGAQNYASSAKSFNIWATILGILITFGLIVLAVLYPGLFDLNKWAKHSGGGN